MNKPCLLLPLVLLLNLLSCRPSPESPKGFSLPQGDAVEGEKVLMRYQCLACHNLEGFDYETVNKELEPPVLLGGTSSQVTTYADLVTSIINPSHKLSPNYPLMLIQEESESKMIVFNEVMTVTELIDLVAFLQPKYKIKSYEYSHYRPYGP